MNRRIKPEKLELDDDIQVLSVSSTPHSAHSNDEDDQDYIDVADKKNNKTIEVPLTDNKLDLKDLQDVFPGVEKLFLKFKDGRERLVKPKDGFFKAPPGGWKTVDVEVLRDNHQTQSQNDVAVQQQDVHQQEIPQETNPEGFIHPRLTFHDICQTYGVKDLDELFLLSSFTNDHMTAAFENYRDDALIFFADSICEEKAAGFKMSFLFKIHEKKLGKTLELFKDFVYGFGGCIVCGLEFDDAEHGLSHLVSIEHAKNHWKVVGKEPAHIKSFLRRAQENNLFGCFGQPQHAEVSTNVPRKTHGQSTVSDPDSSDENSDLQQPKDEIVEEEQKADASKIIKADNAIVDITPAESSESESEEDETDSEEEQQQEKEKESPVSSVKFMQVVSEESDEGESCDEQPNETWSKSKLSALQKRQMIRMRIAELCYFKPEWKDGLSFKGLPVSRIFNFRVYNALREKQLIFLKLLNKKQPKTLNVVEADESDTEKPDKTWSKTKIAAYNNRKFIKERICELVKLKPEWKECLFFKDLKSNEDVNKVNGYVIGKINEFIRDLYDEQRRKEKVVAKRNNQKNDSTMDEIDFSLDSVEDEKPKLSKKSTKRKTNDENEPETVKRMKLLDKTKPNDEDEANSEVSTNMPRKTDGQVIASDSGSSDENDDWQKSKDEIIEEEQKADASKIRKADITPAESSESESEEDETDSEEEQQQEKKKESPVLSEKSMQMVSEESDEGESCDEQPNETWSKNKLLFLKRRRGIRRRIAELCYFKPEWKEYFSFKGLPVSRINNKKVYDALREKQLIFLKSFNKKQRKTSNFVEVDESDTEKPDKTWSKAKIDAYNDRKIIKEKIAEIVKLKPEWKEWFSFKNLKLNENTNKIISIRVNAKTNELIKELYEEQRRNEKVIAKRNNQKHDSTMDEIDFSLDSVEDEKPKSSKKSTKRKANNENEPETVKRMKLLDKTKPNDEDEENLIINVKKIEKQDSKKSKNRYVFDLIEKQNASKPGTLPSKEDLAFHCGMDFSDIFNSPPFIFPFSNQNGSDLHHRHNSFKNKFLNNLRRTLMQIPYNQLLPKFIWKLRGIAVVPSPVETMLPGSAKICQLCSDADFTFKHLFSIPHIFAYQNKYNVDPPHILQLCRITLQHMKKENDVQLKMRNQK